MLGPNYCGNNYTSTDFNNSETHFTYLNGSLCMESTLSFLSSNDGGTGERNLGQANAKHASNSLKSPA